MRKIGIIGSAGTGKSTLGINISKELSIPFLAAKDITRDILKRKNFDWSGSVQVEKFLAKEECQKEILERTTQRENENKEFVTDRTSIELAAYSIAELNHSEHLDQFIFECKEHSKTYTHLIFCPWGLVPLKRNEVRTLNNWYQFVIHSVILTLLQEWKINYSVLSEVDDVQRVKKVLQIIK